MSEIELGNRIILLRWEDEVPYGGYIDIVKSTHMSRSWSLSSLVEDVFKLVIDPNVKFDREVLKEHLRHVKSEICDLRDLVEIEVGGSTECRVVQLMDRDMLRSTLNGEFLTHLNVLQVSARVSARAITKTQGDVG